MKLSRHLRAVGVVTVLWCSLFLTAGCHPDIPGDPNDNPSGTGTATAISADRDVTFDAAGVSVHASLRTPTDTHHAVPAAVLIAGSGPTDRDGNNPVTAGRVDTLRHIADQLSAHGVASLRYDKLSTGATGWAKYANDHAAVTFEDFLTEARAAQQFLTHQPGIDPHRLIIIGHSEGALIALAITGNTNPPPAALALLEPVPVRMLDLVTLQLEGAWTKLQTAGSLTAAQHTTLSTALRATITSLRTTGTLPANLPPPLARIFNPTNAGFLRTIDSYDPIHLAVAVPPATRTLLTCGTADIQIPCTTIPSLDAALTHTHLSSTQLANTDHVLKDVGNSGSDGTEYGKPLPFSHQLDTALAALTDDLTYQPHTSGSPTRP